MLQKDAMLPLVEVTDKSKLSIGSNVSYGIAPILNTLVSMANSIRKVRWTLYLINVETLIRDRNEKDIRGNLELQARSVLYDMQMLGQYIAAYNRIVLNEVISKNRPIVCFYFPDYTVIPREYFRIKLPKGTEERWKIRDAVMYLIDKEGSPTNYENTEVIYTTIGKNKRMWPHKELFTDLVKYIEGIPHRECLMVSHVPLDFHLYRAINKFTILESYTGALKQPKEFGKKVFKDEVFPFNKYTHLLLGDKWYIQSKVSTTERNKLKEKAKKEHWALIPDKAVLSSLVSSRVVNSDILIKPDI